MNENIELVEIPHNIELEQQILAMIIKDDKLIRDVVDSVTSETFYNKYHKEIFKAMLYLHYQNMSVGLETIVHRLQSKKVDDDLINYAIEVSGSHITYSSFQNKIDLLIDLKQKRDLYEHSLRVITKDISGISSSILVKQTKDVIENMGVNNNIENTNIGDYIDTWVTELEDLTPSKVFETGFYGLDDIISIKDGKLIILAARPGCGKSAMAMKMVRSFCEQKFHPLFVSLEMGKKEHLDRQASELTGVNHEKFEKKHLLTSYDWQKIMTAKEKIKKWKFEFNDKGGMTIEQLMGLSRYLKKKDKLDVIIVDYLQLLSSSRFTSNKQAQIEFISQQLKQLALELKIPVIALSQLNRASVENGKAREPQLSDLRSSGSIEQDADVVMMLHTPDTEQKYKERFVTLFVRKNRQGKQGRVDFNFIGDNLRFIEKEKDWDNNTWNIIEEKKFDSIYNTQDDGLPSDVPF